MANFVPPGLQFDLMIEAMESLRNNSRLSVECLLFVQACFGLFLSDWNRRESSLQTDGASEFRKPEIGILLLHDKSALPGCQIVYAWAQNRDMNEGNELNKGELGKRHGYRDSLLESAFNDETVLDKVIT